MKKLILLIPFLVILFQTIHAQVNWGKTEYSMLTSTFSNDKSQVGIVLIIHNTYNPYKATLNEHLLYDFLSKDSTFLKNHSRNFNFHNTADSTKVHFFLNGVTRKNAAEYEFRVVESHDKIMVPWSDITNFDYNNMITDITRPQTTDRAIRQAIAYLGGYKTKWGNNIIVDVRKKGTNKILTCAVIHWVTFSPRLLNIYTANELNEFLKRLQQYGSSRLSTKEMDKWKHLYKADQLDSVTALPKKLKVPATDNNLIFYLRADIVSKDQVEYELVKDSKVIRPWSVNEFDNGFIWLKDLKPGEYLLKMRYTIQRESVTTYPFEIAIPWQQSTAFRIITGILTLGFLGFVIFFFKLITQRQKAKEELSKKEKLQLELKAIYSQLNPHFVFNALSSIQGLINKQDLQGANMYLSDFARLMRDSMTNNNKEQTTLKEEMITLETYLKLEQLRFGFRYNIKTDGINIYETEIPSLLLQPLIENAVKHGISTMKDSGEVNLSFSKNNNDMEVTIQDNGGGFQIKEEQNGYGLKLTKDRIKLLNQIMKGQSIEMNIKQKSPTGTIVSLQFKNWFL